MGWDAIKLVITQSFSSAKQAPNSCLYDHTIGQHNELGRKLEKHREVGEGGILVS